MKPLALALVAAALVGAGATSASPACRVEHVEPAARVDLRCGEDLVRVRLAHVRAPDAGEVGEREAARALRELLRARELVLVLEPAEAPRRDADGRVLAQLYDAERRNLNVALVELGWAGYSSADGESALSGNYRAAERDAQLGQRALWTVWSPPAASAGP